MTIAEFTKRHNPNNGTSFNTDLWSVIDKIGDDRFRQVAIEVLSDISGAELVMKEAQDLGWIVWGKSGESVHTGWVVNYSKAVGQTGMDWHDLLKIICSSSLRNNG